MSTISVLCSVYKNEKSVFLDRMLRSVWSEQTLKPTQIIIVEDGPLTDDLYSVLTKWRGIIDAKLLILKNDVNLGLTVSLNKGIQHVTSDYIARIDSDDMCMPNRFELQSTFLDENPNIDIVGGASEVIDINGNLKFTKHYELTHDEMVRQMYWKCPLSHPGVMMRTSMFTNKGLKYNEKYRNSQDIALWVDALMAGCKFANLPDVVIRSTEDDDIYRRRGNVRARNEYESFARAAKYICGKYSLKRIVPCIRYLFRCLPTPLIRFFYNSKKMWKCFH